MLRKALGSTQYILLQSPDQLQRVDDTLPLYLNIVSYQNNQVNTGDRLLF